VSSYDKQHTMLSMEEYNLQNVN